MADKDIATMPEHEFNSLTEDQARALMDGPAPSDEASETPADEAAETPAQEAQEQAAGEEADPKSEPKNEPEKKKGDPEVPLSHEREKNRLLEQQLQAQQEQMRQMMAMLQNPQATKPAPQPEAPPPDPDLDPVGYANHLVNQAVKPLRDQMTAMQQMHQAQQTQARIAQLTAIHGPETPAMVAHFDASYPQLAHLDPQAKVLMVKGAIAGDPERQKAQVEAAAKEMAEKMVQERLAQATGNNKAPRTLGSLPQSQAQQAPELSLADIASMPADKIAKLTPEQRAAIEKRMR